MEESLKTKEYVTVYPTNIDFEVLNKCIDKLEAILLKNISSNYLQNIRTGQGILNMPLSLPFFTYSSAITEIESEILRKDLLKLKDSSESPEFIKKESENMTKVFLENLNQKDNILKRKNATELKINRLLKNNPQIYKMIDDLNYIILTYFWSATETLYKDIMVETINKYPKVSIKRIDKLLKKDGKSKIEIDEILNDDFILLDSLGDILFGQEVFSNLPRVQKYYSALFKLQSNISSIFEERDLILMKQIRHIIIHNKSLIDGKFIKYTNQKQLKIGEKYPLNREQTIELVNHSIANNIKLLNAIDLEYSKLNA